MNNEKKEKILISLILESSKNFPKLAEKYLPRTKKLFESVFYSEETTPTITLNECRNNKLFYLENVKQKINDINSQVDVDSLKIINESLATDNFQFSVDTFLKDINVEINELKFQNDFDKIDLLNEYAKKTKLWTNSPIVVNGFDVQQFLNPENIISKELLDIFGASIQRDLKELIFNKSDKELYFIFERSSSNEKTVIFYSILTNELDYIDKIDFYERFGTDKNSFIKDLWSNEKNFLKVFGLYINNNLVSLYKNPTKFSHIKFTDNLYGDGKYQELINKIKKQSLIK